MKKMLCAGFLVCAFLSSFAQGTIEFVNRNIPLTSDPSLFYNIPIFAPGGRATGTGAGNMPGGVTVGLFLVGSPDDAAPIVSTPLRTGSATAAQFFAIPTQTAVIPGYPAGSSPALEVRAWQGPSFSAARQTVGMAYLQVAAFSAPLGGTPPGGGADVPTTILAWGSENGAGYQLPVTQPPIFSPEPQTFALFAVGIVAIAIRKRR